jgi:hypothetical protein
MRVRLKGVRERLPAPQATHQDEFPAAYSSVGCSPAEPTSASAAKPIFNQKSPFCQIFSANGNCPRILLSQKSAHSRRLRPYFLKFLRLRSYGARATPHSVMIA